MKRRSRRRVRNAIIVALSLGILTTGGILGIRAYSDSKRVEPKPPPLASTTSKSPQQFLHAREALFAGDFEKAVAGFEVLITHGNTEQPTLNWAHFNIGLCALFESRTTDSKSAFQRILEIDAPPGHAADRDAASFFIDVATKMTQSLPVPADLRTHHPLALNG